MACERPLSPNGCALLLDVSRYRAHASRGLARAPPAVCAASEASRHLISGAATPPSQGGECAQAHTDSFDKSFGCGRPCVVLLVFRSPFYDLRFSVGRSS